MTIRSERLDDDTIVVYLSGRLDTDSASLFETKINEMVDGPTGLIFDFKDLSYISSSGLHVLLHAQKVMGASNRKLVIRNICESVKDVFEITGFSRIVKLEE